VLAVHDLALRGHCYLKLHSRREQRSCWASPAKGECPLRKAAVGGVGVLHIAHGGVHVSSSSDQGGQGLPGYED